MWEYLVGFSTWAENNSGQIQIFIAVIALIYAFKAYKGLLHQLRFSSRQRKFELLSTLNSAVADNYKMLYQASIDYSPIVAKILSVESFLIDNGDPDATKISELRGKIEGQQASIVNQVKQLMDYSMSISKREDVTLAQLEDYQKQLSAITIRTTQIVFYPSDLKLSIEDYLRAKKLMEYSNT